MARSSGSNNSDSAYLIDENEQLRALLETAIEENAALVEERDRLRKRMSVLTQELRATHDTVSQQEERTNWLVPAYERQTQAEEELRVAFEELQVLTEELEVANSGLHDTNQALDARVEQRTHQLEEINAVLQATEASLRAVADLVPDLLWRADASGQADWFNQRWFAYTGKTSMQSLGMGWLEAVHPADQPAARRAWEEAVGSGAPFEHEHRIRDADDEFRWFLVRAEPLREENGDIVRWFTAGTDIHDQRTALEALQRSELRFRTLVEGMPQLVWRSLDGGRWTWSSPQWGDYTGQAEPEMCGLGWLEAIHPDDREAAMEAWKRAPDTGSLEIEGRIFHAAENRHRHFRTRALPVRDGAERVLEWLGTSTDVDDMLQLQDEQAVLVGELQHRTRNLMAVVQAITARTLRRAESLEQFHDSIDDRFSALARVQGLLSRRGTGVRVPFDMLLREELSAHVELADGADSDKVTLEGPMGIALRSSTVQTFALALHELATNAVKYGALSEHGGHLRVYWVLRHDEVRGPQLCVDWRETGVSEMPAPGAPARGGGYGRELIERALPYQMGARTHYAFEPDGVHCTIEVTVPAEHSAMEKSDG